MRTKRIMELKAKGLNSTEVFDAALLEAHQGLYAIAYFGHRGTATEKARIRRLLKRIRDVYFKYEEL